MGRNQSKLREPIIGKHSGAMTPFCGCGRGLRSPNLDKNTVAFTVPGGTASGHWYRGGTHPDSRLLIVQFGAPHRAGAERIPEESSIRFMNGALLFIGLHFRCWRPLRQEPR